MSETSDWFAIVLFDGLAKSAEHARRCRKIFERRFKDFPGSTLMLADLTESELADIARLMLRSVYAEDMENELIQYEEWVKGCLHESHDAAAAEAARDKLATGALVKGLMLANHTKPHAIAPLLDGVHDLSERFRKGILPFEKGVLSVTVDVVTDDAVIFASDKELTDPKTGKPAEDGRHAPGHYLLIRKENLPDYDMIADRKTESWRLFVGKNVKLFWYTDKDSKGRYYRVDHA